MRETCYRFNRFLPYDYAGMEGHLEKMAAKGWYLEKLGSVLWKFRREERGQVRYAVTYLSELSEFNNAPTGEQLMLDEFCREAGWERVTEWHQMQVYRCERPNPIPLETEEAVRLDAICEAMKKGFLRGYIVLVLWEAYLLFRQVESFLRQPISHVTDVGSLCAGLIVILGALFSVACLADYGLWYLRSRRSVARGGSCVSARSGRYLNWAVLTLLIALLLGWLVSLFLESRTMFLIAVLYLAGLALIVWLLRKVQEWLRRRDVSKGNSIALCLGAAVLLSAALVGALTWCAVNVFSGLDGDGTVTYTAPEEMPLTIGDLLEVGDETASCRCSDSATPLASRMVGWQELSEGQETLYLSYEVLETEWTYLYGLCEQEYLLVSVNMEWEQANPIPWGADAAYYRHFDNTKYYNWVICRGTKLLSLSSTWMLTGEQMAVVAQKLLD